MKHKIFLLAIGAIVTVHSGAENRKSWLPVKQNTEKTIRLLECTYDEAQLERCEEITPSSSDWEVSLAGDTDGHITPYGTQYVYE